MEIIQPGKMPQGIAELYCSYGRLESRSIRYRTPFAILAIGSVGIGIKIATGDDALATLYSNKLMAGLHGVGLVAGYPGFHRYTSLQEHKLTDIAQEIAEAEGRQVDRSDLKAVSQNQNRIHEVLRLADRVSPTGMTLFFNRLHFRMEDLLAQITHRYGTEEENAIRQRGDIKSASSKYAIHFLTGVTSEEIAKKGLEIGLYRWDKVAWDVKQPHQQRRYAHQMVAILKRTLQ